MKTLRLGTRRSALALAQSSLVKNALEQMHPDLRIEIIGMDTEGDEVHQNRFSEMPLDQLDGKNFFVKELDEALLAGHTDFSVHSYKDLSLDRPKELVIAAVPPRANPRDIVLFHPRALAKIGNDATITLGFSSPRRSENTPRFLKTVLPLGYTDVEAAPIRGNVPTRIRKLHENPSLDGIVIAMAGLIRLADNAEVQSLLKGLHLMVLPLDACPAAPAQGALAVECRRDNLDTLKILQSLNCKISADAVAREREVLKRFGGGCHQAFGATSITMHAKPITFIHGKSDAGEPLSRIEWSTPNYTGTIRAWDGSAHRKHHTKTIPLAIDSIPGEVVFIAHHRAVTEEVLPLLIGKRIYTSGIKSWQKLAQMGLWTEGAAELSFSAFASTLAEPLLQLPPLKDWVILTHRDGVASWKEGNVIATYAVEENADAPQDIENATHVWWASGSQFLALKDAAKQATHHACGFGKTAEILRAHNINPELFPNVVLWRNSIQ